MRDDYNRAMLEPSTERPWAPDLPSISLRDLELREHQVLRHLHERGRFPHVIVSHARRTGQREFQQHVTFREKMRASKPVIIATHSYNFDSAFEYFVALDRVMIEGLIPRVPGDLCRIEVKIAHHVVAFHIQSNFGRADTEFHVDGPILKTWKRCVPNCRTHHERCDRLMAMFS